MEILLGHMRFECCADMVRSNDGDDSSDDVSPDERAHYETLNPNNALLMGLAENFDSGIDHRFRSSEKVGARLDEEESSSEDRQRGRTSCG